MRALVWSVADDLHWAILVQIKKSMLQQHQDWKVADSMQHLFCML